MAVSVKSLSHASLSRLASCLHQILPRDIIRVGRGTARAEDAQGTPTQSHISPSTLVYEDICTRMVQIPFLTCKVDYNNVKTRRFAVKVSRGTLSTSTQGPSNLNQKSIGRRICQLVAINARKKRTNGFKTSHGMTLRRAFRALSPPPTRLQTHQPSNFNPSH